MSLPNRRDLERRIQEVDQGQAFGTFGEDGEAFYKDRTKRHLKPVREYLAGLESDPPRIGDIGGGNGLVARSLQKRFDGTLEVDVIDIDDSKFPETPMSGIEYLEQDVRKPLPDTYDVTVSRNVLHYNPDAQDVIVNNMVEYTRPGGLIAVIQSAPTPGNKHRVNRLHDWLADVTDSNEKQWLTGDEIQAILAQSVETVRRNKLYNRFGIDEFYKDRYGLDDSQAKKAKRIVGEAVELPTNIVYARKR